MNLNQCTIGAVVFFNPVWCRLYWHSSDGPPIGHVVGFALDCNQKVVVQVRMTRGQIIEVAPHDLDPFPHDHIAT